MFAKGLSKVAFLKKKFALEFLNYKNGDYIETISDYQNKFKASRGSVQIALKELQIEKIIILQSKGASGTQIVKLDYNRLLEILDINTIIGAMPLPYTTRHEGLAASLVQSFKGAPFRFACSYRQGSLNRVKGLMNNYYDFIIISKMASDYYKNIYDFKEILTLEDESYNAKHVWVVNKGVKEITPGMRIGLDKSSFDQFFLVTKAIGNMEANLVDIHFPYVINEILNKNIDAAVWNLDMINNFKSDKIDIIDNLNLNDARAAVIVSKKDRGDIVKIIKDYIKPSIIKNYQEKVMKGIIVPSF